MILSSLIRVFELRRAWYISSDDNQCISSSSNYCMYRFSRNSKTRKQAAFSPPGIFINLKAKIIKKAS